MNTVLAIFYGAIQGLTEFLPVSSSAHLSLAQNFFGFEDIASSNLTFDVMLHLGTLFAVFTVYFKDIVRLIPAFFTMTGKLFKGKFRLKDFSSDERFIIFVIIATLPLVFAFFVKDGIESLTHYPKIIGIILIVNGFILLLSDRYGNGKKQIGQTKPGDALVVGLCQMLALLPGISRSGATISGGKFMGFDREYAVGFSFILSIPAIIGGNVFSLGEMIKEPLSEQEIFPVICGMFSAFVVGICAMKLLQYLSKKSNFKLFAYYCFVIGTLSVIFG